MVFVPCSFVLVFVLCFLQQTVGEYKYFYSRLQSNTPYDIMELVGADKA